MNIFESNLSPRRMAQLLDLTDSGIITRQTMKEVLEIMAKNEQKRLVLLEELAKLLPVGWEGLCL